jgi:predicted helicase
VFHYIYAMLHHPQYRNRFAEVLRRDLPPVIFASDFTAFSNAGRELAEAHVGYERLEPWALTWGTSPRAPVSYQVGKMKLNKGKESVIINQSLTVSGIPAEASQYRLGNRSALEWIIDQYRVRGQDGDGVYSDPNRGDDPEYIVRLVGQVIRLSMETIQIVDSLPKL